ncbi:MAG: GNAT family N-acetyltransferase [Phycisphaerae bacterium]
MNGLTHATLAIRRANQVYFEQVGARTTLNCCYAYVNETHPNLPTCNFVGEVALRGDGAACWDEVQRFFAERQATCSRWIPSAEQLPEELDALLAPHGFVRRESVANILHREAAPPDPRIRVLAARAMRRAYTQIASRRALEHPRWSDALTSVQLERLNDAQYDAFVALRGDEPLAMAALLQVGEIGRLCDMYVIPEARRQGIGAAMVSYLIATAKRWRLRPIVVDADATNTAGRRLLAQRGFTEDGTIVSLCRADVAEVFA